jgi:hypothetical protein
MVKRGAPPRFKLSREVWAGAGLEGVVYLPRQQVTIAGTAQSFVPSPWTWFIAVTIQITDNGSFVINNNTALTPVPIPAGLKMRTGGRLWLTQ